MLREYAPLIAVSVVIAIMFYLVFRDLRSLRAGFDQVATQLATEPSQLPPQQTLQPRAQAPQIQAAAAQAVSEPAQGTPTAQPQVSKEAAPATKQASKRA